MDNDLIIEGEMKLLAHLLTLRSGLKLELMGFRHSTNAVFKTAKLITGERTRQGAFEKISEMIKQIDPRILNR